MNNNRINRLVPGSKWQHFRGNIYTIIAIAHNAENSNEQLVIYKNPDKHRFWARPIKSFLEVLGDDTTHFYRFSEVTDEK